MILESSFTPPWYLRNEHLQTLAASTFRRISPIEYNRERLELPDGDFVDLDWGEHFEDQTTVVILHGLEGSSSSNYVVGLVHALRARKLNAVVMNFRGCSGEPNRLKRSYTAGETDDLAYVVNTISERFTHQPIAAVGYSLGGNVLLKWLGEMGAENPLTSAVAVSVPYKLMDAAQRMELGLSKVYQAHLLRHLRTAFREHNYGEKLNINDDQLRKLNTFYDFDNQVTAPLHGYKGVEDYYAKSSSLQFLKNIQRPTLLLHAEDDPFMFPETLPKKEELSASIQLEWSKHGGHVGFVSRNPHQRYWLEHRIPLWITKQA